MTASSYHLDSFSSTELGPEPGENLAGVQLPQADLVHQTAPGLFDTLPEEFLTDAHRALQNWPHAGDRMLLALHLPVSQLGQRVALALLWHGWSSIPSRERISEFTEIADVSNVTKGVNDLVKAGVLFKRQRTATGRGYVGNRLTFNGLVICKILVESNHPTMAAVAQEVLDAHARLGAESAEGRGVPDTPRGGEDGFGEESRGVPDTPRVGELEESFVARGVPRHTPPGVYDIHHNHDLIDIYTDPVYESINQKVRGVPDTPRGSVGPCQSCGLAELTAAVCPGCGAVASAADDSSAWPEWYKELAGLVEADNLPAWGSLYDDQQLAGWSEAVMVEAADRYAHNYAGQRVTVPSTLFRKIANGVVYEQRRSGGSGSGSGSRSSGRRAGGSGVPGDAGRR